MAQASDIVAFLDGYLDTVGVSDRYSSNGLQVEGAEQVERVGFCVDACLETFDLLQDCRLLVVHHGLFWPSISSLTGPARRSFGYLIERNIGLYCSHLPLDLHAEVGNNAQLIEKLGWRRGDLFEPVGWFADGPQTTAVALQAKVSQLLGVEARLLAFGPSQVSRMAVSSGGASLGMVYQALEAGAQLFLTGEASHPIYHAAKEAGLNVLLGGHYATETWGVKALMPVLEDRFGVSTRFVDVPTGF